MSFSTITILVVLNVGLIYLLLAAPIGSRNVTVRRRIKASRKKLWEALFPLGENAGWDGKILESTPSGSSGARLTLSWMGRDNRPIERDIHFHEVVSGERFTQIVSEDSSLDHSFWRNYRETVEIAGTDDEVTVSMSIRDSYHGLAFVIFRYFSLRRTIERLKHWAETGDVRHGGIFEKPLTQAGFAVISALLLWPLFGLSVAGLMLAITLTMVVALHELGHMAAFRLMGHKSVRMIFIPILGAVAIGGRPYDRRFEIAFVALMGAGFSAFLVVPAIAGAEWAQIRGQGQLAVSLTVFAGFCAVFNLANLVPVWRFDGGQILRQLFQDRLALSAVSFGIFIAAMAAGLTAGMPPTAVFVGGTVFAVLSFMTAGRSAKPRHAMKPMSTAERAAIAAGFLASATIHGSGLLWAADRLLG